MGEIDSMANTGRFPAIPQERNFKRWFDKAFVGLMTATLGLIIFIWNSLSGQVGELDKASRSGAERVTRQEEVQKSVNHRLERIEVKQDRQDEKLDRILNEVRK